MYNDINNGYNFGMNYQQRNMPDTNNFAMQNRAVNNQYAGMNYNNQVSQIQQPNMIRGRFVVDQNQITLNDVPMDGGISVFPKSDFTEIYCKTWDQNGVIQTRVFKPVDTIPESKSEELITVSKEFVNNMTIKIDELTKELQSVSKIIKGDKPKGGASK